MIAERIEDDHDAGREVFAVVGNATQPSWDERGDEMRGLAALWAAHGVMLDCAVLPRLAGIAEAAGLVERLRALQAEVAELAADLARRAPGRDADGRWLADFERLRRRFDAQCRVEGGELVAVIHRCVPPDAIAAMTREARALREG